MLIVNAYQPFVIITLHRCSRLDTDLLGDMEGSEAASWRYDTLISTNVHTLSEEIGNDTTMIENIMDPHLTCEQIQEVFGQPLPIPVNIENVLRYIQAIYYIFNLVFGVSLNLFMIVLTLYFKSYKMSHSSLVFRYVLAT